VKQGNCNCYEGIDQMINEGGYFQSFIYSERLLKELGMLIPEIDIKNGNKEEIRYGIS